MTSRPLRVFLCHSSADKPAVRELYQKLRAEPWIQPWLDEEELFPGMDWNMEIEKAIEETDVILVCLSNSSITKEGYVQKEIKTALDYSDYKPDSAVFIIPVRLEECKPPSRLSKWQYADYFESQRDLGLQRLLKSLKIRAESLEITEVSAPLPINLKLNDDGFETSPDDELMKAFVDAIYAAQNGFQVKFEVLYVPLEQFEEICKLDRFNDSSLDTHITKNELRKIADHSRTLKKNMEDALSLISTKSIANQISSPYELVEIINGVPRILSRKSANRQRNSWLEAVYGTPTNINVRKEEEETGIEIFHRKEEISTYFYVGKNDAQKLYKKIGINGSGQLMGGGWDFYDLTKEIRFEKAIPAILLEVATNQIVKDKKLDIDMILHPSSWLIGLH